MCLFVSMIQNNLRLGKFFQENGKEALYLCQGFQMKGGGGHCETAQSVKGTVPVETRVPVTFRVSGGWCQQGEVKGESTICPTS